MICKGCGNNRDLIKAHIIPRSFYMNLRGAAKYLNIVPSAISKRIIKSNIGDYDTGILCSECDQYLGSYDDYGKRVLIDGHHHFERIERRGLLVGWTIKDCDASRLEKFILAILWRASISSRTFFRKVNLGPYENILKDHLWSSTAHHESFSCALAKFTESKVARGAEKTMLDPHPFKFEDRNYYRLYLGGYVVWVRVDSRKSSARIAACELSNGRDAIVVCRSFDESKEFGLIHRGAQNRGRQT